MPFTEAQAKLIRGANRRLAIFALLQSGDSIADAKRQLEERLAEVKTDKERRHLQSVIDLARPRRHRFAKDADPDAWVAKLSAQSLFDEIRPELRFLSDPANPKTTVTISDLTFQSYSVFAPSDPRVAGQPTKAMQILRHSHLLEKLDQLLPGPGAAALDRCEVSQRIGADLFRDLVKQLDVIVQFDHPRFTAALTRVLQVYVPSKANEKLPDTELIDASALQRWLIRDVSLRGQLIKYLLELEDDDPATRSEVGTTLGTIVRSKEDSPFHPSEEVWARQIDAVLATLADLKAGMLNDAVAAREYLVKQAGPWVKDTSKSGEYHFPHPTTGKGDDFLAIFRAAKAASDWVARFVRTEAMHSFLVCWLASKYRQHTQISIGETAEEMFRVGIKEVRGRAFAQNRRDVRGYMDLIDERTKEAADKAKAEAQPHLAIVKERIKSYFLPASAYTRERQLERAARLFVTACQLAGGSVKELHDRNTDYSDALNSLQQHVLKFSADMRKVFEFLAAAKRDNVNLDQVSEERLPERLRQVPQEQRAARIQELEVAKAAAGLEYPVWLTELKADLKEREPKQVAFIERAFTNLPEVTTTRAVNQAYVNGFTADILAQFNAAFDTNYAKILDEKKELEHLFGLWCGVALEGKGDTAGLTTFIAPKGVSSEAAAALPEKERKKLPEVYTEALKARAVAGKTKVVSAVPEPVATRLGNRAKTGLVPGRLLNGDQEVGSATVVGAELVVTRKEDTTAAKPSELEDTSNLRLDFGLDPADPDQGPIEFELRNLKDVSTNELFPLTRPGGRMAVAAAVNYDKLSERMEGCHEKYREGGDANAAFRRTMRAAKLAQAVLAAPRGKVNLDARDLSNSLGLMQEMVEKYGDHTAQMFGTQPDASTTPESQRLKEVNLSEFYPLADDDHFDMGKILAYHYKLCDTVKGVAGYLRELRELRDFFDAVAESDLEVEVVNRTLADYATNPDDLFLERPPLAAYFTLQAVPQAPGALASLGTFLTGLIGDTNYPNLQLPLAVLAPEAGAAPPGVAIPVVAADVVRLPDLDVVAGPRRIQNPPHLLWLASLIESSKCSFGPPADFIPRPPFNFNPQLKAAGLPEWNVRLETVHQYLRKAWAHSTPAMETLSDQIVLLKWVNAALLLRKPFGNWPVWVRDTLAEVYGPPGAAAAGGGEAAAGSRAGSVLYPIIFAGLPIGTTPVEVEVRFDADAAATPLNNIVSPNPNAVLVVGGRAVTAPWTPH